MTFQDAYALAGVDSPRALYDLYCREDQRLFKSGQWDYDNHGLLINRIKVILEQIDPMTLSPQEKKWRQEILWYWHHHAISCAIWIKKDWMAARVYAAMAILRQGGDHPNQITRLLFLLVHDRWNEAVKWVSTMTRDKDEAKALLEEYKRGEFF